MFLRIAFGGVSINNQRYVDVKTASKTSTIVVKNKLTEDVAPTSYDKILKLVNTHCQDTGTPFSEQTHDIYLVSMNVVHYPLHNSKTAVKLSEVTIMEKTYTREYCARDGVTVAVLPKVLPTPPQAAGLAGAAITFQHKLERAKKDVTSDVVAGIRTNNPREFAANLRITKELGKEHFHILANSIANVTVAHNEALTIQQMRTLITERLRTLHLTRDVPLPAGISFRDELGAEGSQSSHGRSSRNSTPRNVKRHRHKRHNKSHGSRHNSRHHHHHHHHAQRKHSAPTSSPPSSYLTEDHLTQLSAGLPNFTSANMFEGKYDELLLGGEELPVFSEARHADDSVLESLRQQYPEEYALAQQMHSPALEDVDENEDESDMEDHDEDS